MLQVHTVTLSRGTSVPLVCFVIDEEKACKSFKAEVFLLKDSKMIIYVCCE